MMQRNGPSALKPMLAAKSREELAGFPGKSRVDPTNVSPRK